MACSARETLATHREAERVIIEGMTLDEAKEIAKEVLANKTRSHVRAARELSEFILAGSDFAERSRVAAAAIRPLTPEAVEAFAKAPEVSGGEDVEPSDAPSSPPDAKAE